ncbi:hypothetical protein G7Y89_g11597 [Cudoniella acicularis]|uniref:NACHT-NTPase and P-loop NTPases N-terminal domain-containing protein n=1 Tax=Cudoniella acicularis TaxID=354080 RepID=A0A8H4RCX8_9HELO|nr:hypothetical protein G7Y89_g11597 [Cudoniella acicularis]
MEPFSAAAGAISFVSTVVEVVGTIQTLVEFYKSIQEAAPHFSVLVNELEILSEALKECTQYARDDDHDTLTKRAVKACTAELLALEKALKKFEPGIKSKRFAKQKFTALKIVIKSSEIQRMRDSIAKATDTVRFVKELSFQLLSEIPEALSKSSNGRTEKGLTIDEVEYTYVLFPSTFLNIFGFSNGFRLDARHADSWQYSLRTFNAVPGDSVIFDFCQDGNVMGIRTLLQRGEASVRDTDPDGRTPLWVAVQALQFEVAEMLLQSGADSSLSPWSHFTKEPITGIDWSNKIEVEKKLSMLALLQSYAANGYDESTVLHMAGQMLLFYRMCKKFPMSQSDRRDVALNKISKLIALLPADDVISRSRLVYFMLQVYYHQKVLSWTIQDIPGPFWEGSRAESCFIILQAFKTKLPYRDPVSMRLITQKTLNLHRIYSQKVHDVSYASHFTATSLAMRQPSLFFPWRDILVDLGRDIEEFVRKELEPVDSPLRAEGWNHETLCSLFRCQFFPQSPGGLLTTGFFSCERCGAGEPGQLMVSLPWRRHLRTLRTKASHEICCGESPANEVKRLPLAIVDANVLKDPVYSVEDSELVDNDAKIYREEKSLLDRINLVGEAEPWPYRIVCHYPCRDGVSIANVYENLSSDEPVLPPLMTISEEKRQLVAPGPVRLVEITEEEKGECLLAQNQAVGWLERYKVGNFSSRQFVFYILTGIALIFMIYRAWYMT